MKILVAGATGKTGLRLINELKSRGHHPIALVRESSDTAALPSDVELRYGDLTDLQDGACDGCDAVIFAAGSGGDTGPEMTDKVDRDGAKRLVDLAAKAKVARFAPSCVNSIVRELPRGCVTTLLLEQWRRRSNRRILLTRERSTP